MKSRWLLLVIPLLVILVIVQLVRPVPALQAQTLINQTIQVPGAAPTIHWPKEGQAVLAVDGVGTMGQFGQENPVPIASVAKIMTAYLTLQKHPLQAGADGPVIKVTADDVATYNQDNAQGESVAPVVAGEQLTERQALEALLLPSANNVATLLAKFNSGSESAFVDQMNQTAKKLGMKNTHYADASGFLPTTVSTAVDQTKLVEAAMKDQSFREIVSMPQATLPTAGTVYNVDYVLGKDGIIGVKTGNTDQAGGCFAFAANQAINGKTYLIVGAVLGQQGDQPLMQALDASLALIQDAQKSLTSVSVLTNGKPVANISAPWNAAQTAKVEPTQSVSFVGWPGMTIHTQMNLTNPTKQVSDKETVGNIQLTAGDEKVTVPLQASGTIQGPSYLWKLKHL